MSTITLRTEVRNLHVVARRLFRETGYRRRPQALTQLANVQRLRSAPITAINRKVERCLHLHSRRIHSDNHRTSSGTPTNRVVPNSDPVKGGLSSTTSRNPHEGSDVNGASLGGDRVIVRNQYYDGGSEVIHISINNPKKLNSLDSALMSDLCAAFQSVSSNESVRCIVLRGEQDASSQKRPSFCAGASLDEMSNLKNSKEAKGFITKVGDLCTAVSECPVPVISAIHGHCYGGGLELAASCDVRYATKLSLFAMPEVLVGIPSVVQARHLVDIMGWARARYLMMFGKTINADEAYQQGLLNEVFEGPEDMERRVQQDVDTLLTCGPTAVRVQKELIRSWKTMDANAGIGAGVEAFAGMWDDGGTEPKEYMKRALLRLKGRKPDQ